VASTPFYDVIDHTADIGIEVNAATREEIFVRCGLAMFDLMVGLGSIAGTATRTVGVRGTGPPELLVAWLNELLYLYAVDGMLFCGFTDADLGERSFTAVGCGERLNTSKHHCEMEIKAATYHDLALIRADDRWIARVIFDV
jgi:SHS2 domain-containing protein